MSRWRCGALILAVIGSRALTALPLLILAVWLGGIAPAAAQPRARLGVVVLPFADYRGVEISHFPPARAAIEPDPARGQVSLVARNGSSDEARLELAPGSRWDGYRAGLVFATTAYLSLVLFIAVLLENVQRRRHAERRLGASQERLNLTLRAAGVGLYDIDLVAGAIQVSDQYARMLGYDASSFSETLSSWSSRLHPDDRVRVRAKFQHYVAAGTGVYTDEFRLRAANGQWRWMLSQGEIVERDASGMPLRMLGIHLDISDRKHIQQDLERFKETLDMTQDCVFMFDPQSLKFIYVNKGAAEQLGYAHEYLAGLTPMDITPKLDTARFRRITTKLKHATRRSRRFSTELRRADGSTMPVEAEMQYVEPQHGAPRFVAIMRDVTERNRALQLLRQSKSHFATLFDESPVPLSVTRVSDGLYLDVNNAFLEQYRFAREDIVGKLTSTGIYVDPDQRTALIQKVKRDGSIFRFETEYRSKTGKVRICLVSGRAFDADGVEALLTAATDVTAERRAQRRIEELNATLEARVEERTRELERAQAELVQAEKNAALGRLVAGVAHELNTPIGNALLITSHFQASSRDTRLALAQGDADIPRFVQDAEETAALVVRNLQRAADLVTSFKRVAVDRASAQRRIFDLAGVVAENVATLRPGLRHGYRLEQDVAPGLQLDSYPGPLGQVVTNLVDNAIRHGFDGRENGVVKITARQSGTDGVTIRVSDDGNGIAATDMHRVFEPFFTTRLGRGGSGLGLSIVHNIVTSVLGGSIEAGNAVGGGAVLTVSLPLIAPAPHAPSDDALRSA